MPRARSEKPTLKLYRGKWCVEYWDGGTRKRSSAQTSNRASAEQFLSDFESTLEACPLKLTVTEALSRYIESRRGKVMALSRSIEAAAALSADIGNLRVDQINQSRWDRYAAGRTVRPRPHAKPETIPSRVSPGTLRRELNVLRAALRLAWRDDYLPKPPVLRAPPEPPPRERYLAKTEARKLLDAAETPHVRLFVALAMYTGARRGAILTLTWDRVHFDTGMIDFRDPDRPETSKRRAVVPMTSGLRAEMERAYGVRDQDCATVIEYAGRATPFGLRWSFKKLCVKAGLSWTPTPHHFKHSVASWFAMDKVPIDQAADWLNTDPKTLRKVYRKFDPTYLRSVASSLDF